jgi:tRNA pseudouridine32 synthase/23S rRNA pseudouridine746 synthase
MSRRAVLLALALATTSALQRLHVVGETSRWVVVDKPSGVPCHASDKGDGVLTLLRRDAVERGEREAAVAEYRLVHRLDDGTSGCLAIAKDRETANLLGAAFRERRARKACVVAGDLDKARRGAFKLARTRTAGACAVTAITRTAGLGAAAAGDAARKLLVARPITGKTHQIRVAAKSLGAPLLGDDLYGGAPADRLYLHAAALAIDDAGLDVSTPPRSGASFLSARFTAAWASLDWAAELADDRVPRSARSLLP